MDSAERSGRQVCHPERGRTRRWRESGRAVLRQPVAEEARVSGRAFRARQGSRRRARDARAICRAGLGGGRQRCRFTPTRVTPLPCLLPATSGSRHRRRAADQTRYKEVCAGAAAPTRSRAKAKGAACTSCIACIPQLAREPRHRRAAELRDQARASTFVRVSTSASASPSKPASSWVASRQRCECAVIWMNPCGRSG